MYELKKMLEKELHQLADSKHDLTPDDLHKIKWATESIYYITAADAMERGYSDEYSGRMYPTYSRDSYYAETSGRHRDSMGRFSRDSYSHDGYSSHDIESKRAFLEEMMRDARTAEEKEMYRRKLDELNR